jgi:hypothetical protein
MKKVPDHEATDEQLKEFAKTSSRSTRCRRARPADRRPDRIRPRVWTSSFVDGDTPGRSAKPAARAVRRAGRDRSTKCRRRASAIWKDSPMVRLADPADRPPGRQRAGAPVDQRLAAAGHPAQQARGNPLRLLPRAEAGGRNQDRFPARCRPTTRSSIDYSEYPMNDVVLPSREAIAKWQARTGDDELGRPKARAAANWRPSCSSVQDMARESGAVGSAPASVLNQTGRQAKCVEWVRDAWTRSRPTIPTILPSASFRQRAEHRRDELHADRARHHQLRALAQLTDAGLQAGHDLRERARRIRKCALTSSLPEWRASYLTAASTTRQQAGCGASLPTARLSSARSRTRPISCAANISAGRRVLAADSDVPIMPDQYHDADHCVARVHDARRPRRGAGAYQSAKARCTTHPVQHATRPSAGLRDGRKRARCY